ncbi:MAG: lamin tail domain-containing protein, partial [Actinobacteria bacterium]
CSPVAPAGVVAIDHVEYDAPGNDNQNLNEEWVRFVNEGATGADLTGWGVKDESASHRYGFPERFALAPGASVVLHTGCGTDTAADLYWCNTGSAVWNNDGDTVFLLDPGGNIVAAVGY